MPIAERWRPVVEFSERKAKMSHLPSNPSKSFRNLNPHIYGKTVPETDSIPPDSEPKLGVNVKPMAASAREGNDPVRRVVRITSFRCRLLDERNLFDKHFVDALRYAGVLFDDSPAWCQVEVTQRQVGSRDHERTEIEVFDEVK